MEGIRTLCPHRAVPTSRAPLVPAAPVLGAELGCGQAAAERRQREARHRQGFSTVVCSLPRRQRVTHPLPAAPAAATQRGAAGARAPCGGTGSAPGARAGRGWPHSWGAGQQGAGEGPHPAAGRDRPGTPPPRPPSSILPTHQPPKLFCFQPGEESREQVPKPGRRDSSLPALHPARNHSLQSHRCTGPAPAPPRTGPKLPRPQHSRWFYFQIHSSSLFWKSHKITEPAALPTCAST